MKLSMMIRKSQRKIRQHLPGAGRFILDELKANGAKIGKGVMIYDPASVVIDTARPWLLEIGDYTKITHGAVILTHDYSLSTIRRRYGEWIGEGKVTSIGSNCFIGVNSVILMGSKIGNNVIVGAGSIVHGETPDDVVIAGNPARVICTLDEYYRKRRNSTADEAIACARRFRSVKGHDPSPADLKGFKFLFTPRSRSVVEEYGLSFECTGDEPAEVEQAFYDSEPLWEDFEAFLSAARSEHEDTDNT